ncbi:MULTISPECIES: group II truncated hemoglobin [Sphingobium]|uniref:Group II truncated hemoglobin n=2 Tax=Sphingobium TaxID=165695 RepID=A0A9X7UEB6_SPHYA|nr:group II truncated hemoglobin [Sphingobium yanoikuyae]QNG48738.1 group II truncated hemoglobin [Sphingobium yanoikuyae]
MTAAANQVKQTPFDMIGGAPVVRQVVDRFYDLMDSERDYAALRAMHAEDLAPMRTSLSGFLIAWLGGPRDWFSEHPGVCVMSAHAKLAIDRESADQWVDAMRRAVTEAPIDSELGTRMMEALSGMAQGMVRRPASVG